MGGWRAGRQGLGNVRGETEVPQDLADDRGVVNGGDEAHPTPAPGTGKHVEVERSAHQVGPCGERVRLDLWVRDGARVQRITYTTAAASP